MFRTLSLAAVFGAALSLSTGAAAMPTTYSGITFPDGDISFADEVISFNPGPDVAAPHDDQNLVLGAPDGSHISLGDNGSIIVRFSDNSLTTSGDATADLHIFEVGARVEVFNIAISQDLVNWIDLGDLSGQPTSIDIDAVAGVVQFAQYSYVRLTDVDPNQTGSPFGEADIDAIGAISSAPPVAIHAPGALAFLGLGFAAMMLRRRR
ncbi:MAG: PEP-CTERM sorting domain-containing protein [Rhodospirillaceae bacterium]|nr:PEP-CTERM sorting domain-containing protein [Rhodospirillaceae bacterium]MBT6286006.1 PEP-CTERM sorting domain-containing protein [Rhodospirillaceae bacterium]